MKKLRTHLVEAAKAYFNITEAELHRRIEKTTEEINKEWHTRKDNDSFYKDTEWQIYGHIGFNDDRRVYSLLHPIRYVRNSAILDYGGGIGEIGMTTSNYNNIFYYDLDGKTQNFAKFLSKHTKRPITFLNKEETFKRKYNGIILADVLEHLKDPIQTTKEIIELIEPQGFLLTTGLDFSIGSHIPMHLKENREYRAEFMELIGKSFALWFFEATINETIYGWIKRGQK